MYLIVEVKKFRVIFFDLSGPIYSCFSFHRIELSLNRTVQKQISLTFLLILDRLVPQSLNERIRLDCEMLSAVDGSGSNRFKASVKVDPLLYDLPYAFPSFRGLLRLFPRRRLNVIFILDYSSVGVASDHSWIIHEIGAVKSDFFSVLGFDSCDFGLSCEVKLSGGMFHY